MADWKYHVTSLVAVFLALGIGIVVGSTMIGDRAVVSQQSSMLTQLEGDLAALRETNARLRREAGEARRAVEEAGSAARGVLPVLLAGRLKGVSVALVADGQVDPQGLKQVLEQAGAAVVSVTELHLSGAAWPEITGLVGIKEGGSAERSAKLIGQRLGEAIALGSHGDMVRAFLGRKWLTCEGEYGRGAGTLVVLCGGRQSADRATAQVCLSLARYWQHDWGPVAAATPDADAVLKPYRDLGVAVVAGIGSPWSEAAVVTALMPKK